MIPTQLENPKGLHQRYLIQKLVPSTQLHKEQQHIINECVIPDNPLNKSDYVSDYMTAQVDNDAEYFVMRLDTGGSDIEHIKACRIGVNAYADAIRNHLPELSKDLKEKYPLI